MKSATVFGLCAVLVLAMVTGSLARITHLDVQQEVRTTIMIEPFAYRAGGFLGVNVTDFSIKFTEELSESPRMGFVLLRVPDVAAAAQELSVGCIEDHVKETDIDFQMERADDNSWHDLHFSHDLEEDGMYYLFFYVCELFDTYDFKIKVVQHNPGPMYLSVGESPLPFVYFTFLLVNLTFLALWVIGLKKNRSYVHKIHYLMLFLVVLKICTMFFESLRFHYLKRDGVAPLMSSLYYLFAVLKGIMLFTVILLIGTGWSILKPFLSGNEKTVLMVVIPMQVIANIAMIVIEETVPGANDWIMWQNILSLFDIACCCAVLFPIVWSIRSLRESAERDGKAARNLQKLRQFRAFYVFVIAYIYLTRVILVIFSTYLSYEYKWVSIFLSESVAAAFYFLCGLRFRPQQQSPYIRLNEEEEEELRNAVDEEFQITEGIPLQETSSTRVTIDKSKDNTD